MEIHLKHLLRVSEKPLNLEPFHRQLHVVESFFLVTFIGMYMNIKNLQDLVVSLPMSELQSFFS